MGEQDGDSEPAHHARRPMNAFLIFCKRHRSVVRDKYPNLENRSITKILGEWWAILDKEEKACYTGLAKQYKDAFFSANPDFKWYKLPAPPLRTLGSRPREPHEKTNDSPTFTEYQQEDLERTNNNSTQVDLNKPNVYEIQQIDQKPTPAFTPGKLADEAHMGGLSSLLAIKTETQSLNPYYSPPPYKFNSISSPMERSLGKNFSREASIRELQNALSETTRLFEGFEDKGRIYRHEPQNDFTNQDVIDQIVDKRYLSKDEEFYQKQWDEDEKNQRSGRSCKGKRYQEFMAVGGLIVNKRQKREHPDKSPEEAYTASCSWEAGNPRDEATPTDEAKHNAFYNDTSIESETNADPEAAEPDSNANKTFKAADFDLDAKIRALPSLSLEKFQQKKRENKRKKKTIINIRPKAPESVNAAPRPFVPKDRKEMAEHFRENVIGSQKRKPRKISITRFEINSLISSADLNRAYKTSPEIMIATEAPCTVVQSMDHTQSAHSDCELDLMALATLAEVAANTSKMEETAILEGLAEMAEENASKV